LIGVGSLRFRFAFGGGGDCVGGMASSADTIAALATPVGTSALALVRASGPRCAALVAEIFGGAPLPRQAVHGDYRSRSGPVVDDVVFTFFAAPRSYTGEDLLEISAHGNPFIVQTLLEDLCARGCRPAEPGEFTKRAFLNGRMDLSQAEAVADLIAARSERALAAANLQLRGALGRRVQDLTDRLVDLLARVEAFIDFPDEDLPPEDRATLAAGLAGLQADVSRVLATDRYGQVLRAGVKTVILGEPNAGKSSLLNRLLGRERALVSAEPGTTRDYLEEPVALGPHCIRLIDTAGLSTSPTPLERRGMAQTLARAAEADLLLLVLDATRPAPLLMPEIAALLTPATALVVVNKIDLPVSTAGPALPHGLPVIRMSALTGDGVDELVAAIVRHAESFRQEQGEDLVAINARHATALRHATEHLRAAIEKISGNGPPELLASDLRAVLDAFGEIAGRIDNERVLDRIFTQFCIGK
jgi:tRNA modification GTPase